MTVQEGQHRTQSIGNVEEMRGEQSIIQLKTRALSKCSLCSSYEHTARTCPQRHSYNPQQLDSFNV